MCFFVCNEWLVWLISFPIPLVWLYTCLKYVLIVFIYNAYCVKLNQLDRRVLRCFFLSSTVHFKYFIWYLMWYASTTCLAHTYNQKDVTRRSLPRRDDIVIRSIITTILFIHQQTVKELHTDTATIYCYTDSQSQQSTSSLTDDGSFVQ